jgi:hypothetical protein
VIVNDDLPTSTVLELKLGQYIENANASGKIAKIEIQETDEFLQFLFGLDNQKQIVVRKLKQVC